MNVAGQQDDSIEWTELLAILLGTPSEALHATLERRGDGDSDARYEVWRQGRKLRVEKDGVPDYICDGETIWSFLDIEYLPVAHRYPVTGPVGTLRYYGRA